MRVAAVDLASPADADAALDALIAAGATAVELEGDPPIRALGLFADDAALDPGWRVSHAETVDWGSVWAASVRPIRMGPLALDLEVGPAFGSGLHPTTALCLEHLVERPPRGAVLDVGTGNGILAIAALRLGADRAVAIDTDRAALRVAARNLARQGLSERATLGERLPDERFDLVIANVLASTLVDLAPRLVRAMGPGGEAALSGIGPHQADSVAAAWRHVGARVLQVVERDGWCRMDLAAPWG